MRDVEKLLRQIMTILQRNKNPDFLRLALTRVAVLEKVWYEKKQQSPTKE